MWHASVYLCHPIESGTKGPYFPPFLTDFEEQNGPESIANHCIAAVFQE